MRQRAQRQHPRRQLPARNPARTCLDIGRCVSLHDALQERRHFLQTHALNGPGVAQVTNPPAALPVIARKRGRLQRSHHHSGRANNVHARPHVDPGHHVLSAPTLACFSQPAQLRERPKKERRCAYTEAPRPDQRARRSHHLLHPRQRTDPSAAVRRVVRRSGCKAEHTLRVRRVDESKGAREPEES